MLGTPLGLRKRVELSTLGVSQIQSSSVIVLTLTYNLLKRILKLKSIKKSSLFFLYLFKTLGKVKFLVSIMEPSVDHSEVENEVGKDIGQTMCNSVENAEHRAPRIQNPKNSSRCGVVS